MTKFSNRPNGGRLNLRATSALTGSLALVVTVLPGAAYADNECGVAPVAAGTVTCTPANNPYPAGITYIAPPADLTIVLQDGVRVDTSGSLNPGIRATGDVALTINGGTSTVITTTGDGAYGALVTTNADPLSVTLDRIVTSGANADAINVTSTGGTATVNSGAITTTGANANGVLIPAGVLMVGPPASATASASPAAASARWAQPPTASVRSRAPARRQST